MRARPGNGCQTRENEGEGIGPHLEVVVVQADDLDVGEASDLARRAANTAANVQDTHFGTEVHLRREVVLVAGERRGEALALVEAREVEGAAPAILVQLRSTVVVTCTSSRVQ